MPFDFCESNYFFSCFLNSMSLLNCKVNELNFVFFSFLFFHSLQLKVVLFSPFSEEAFQIKL